MISEQSLLSPEDILKLFKQTNALLDGHFVLRSGLHSRQYFQCAILLQYPRIAQQVCQQLAHKVAKIDCDTVISPAIGGLFVGHEVGKALDKRHIFVEKENEILTLRRGFQIKPNERFIIVEDVVTRGGRVQETVDIVRGAGAEVAAIITLVDRSGGNRPDFKAPFFSLLELNVETFEADKLPPDLVKMPITTPGSK